MADALPKESAARHRQEAFELLETVICYASLAQGHLQLGDDAGTIWDSVQLWDFVQKYRRALAPIREAMKGAPRAGALSEAAE